MLIVLLAYLAVALYITIWSFAVCLKDATVEEKTDCYYICGLAIGAMFSGLLWLPILAKSIIDRCIHRY